MILLPLSASIQRSAKTLSSFSPTLLVLLLFITFITGLFGWVSPALAAEYVALLDTRGKKPVVCRVETRQPGSFVTSRDRFRWKGYRNRARAIRRTEGGNKARAKRLLSKQIRFHSKCKRYTRSLLKRRAAVSTQISEMKSQGALRAPVSLLRMNVGGGEVLDSAGNVWSADSGFSGGDQFLDESPISGTQDDVLYQSERYAENLSYNIPFQNGDYTVRLLFSELYFGSAGERVFSGSIEGVPAFSSLDIYQQAGKYAAYVVEKSVTISGGSLQLEFTSQENNAKLSGIEVLSQDVAVPTPTVVPPTVIPPTGIPTERSLYRINAGGPSVRDSAGLLWYGDASYAASGSEFSYSSSGPEYGQIGEFSVSDSVQISGTQDDILYRSETFGEKFNYRFFAPSGDYRVRLHFAEIADFSGWPGVGDRIARILLEGNIVRGALDIFGQVGRFASLVIEEDLTVRDGTLNIEFDSLANNAKISAIEVLRLSSISSPRPTPTPTPNGCVPVSLVKKSHTFSQTNVGDQSTVVTFSIKNVGTSSLNLGTSSLTGFNPNDFLVSQGILPSLSPGATAIVQTRFRPLLAATRMAAVEFPSSNACSPIRFDLFGVGANSVDPSGETVRINSGGLSYTDQSGNLWLADQDFSGGDEFTSSNSISGTQDDPIYQSERYGDAFSYAVPVENGSYDVRLHFAEIFWTLPGQRVFSASIEGQEVEPSVDIVNQVGSNAALILSHDVEVTDDVLNIDLSTIENNAKLSGIEIIGGDAEHTSGHPFLHVVIDDPGFAVDYDGNGSEPLFLDASPSHTHEPGKALTDRHWTVFPNVVGNQESITVQLPVGTHEITHTIEDNNSPQDNLSLTTEVSVYPVDAVKGVLTNYYEATSGDLESALDSLFINPVHRERRDLFDVKPTFGNIGGSSLKFNAIVVLEGELEVSTAGNYQFNVQGGSGERIFVNGTPYSGSRALNVGKHLLEVRIAAQSTAVLPAIVTWNLIGQAAQPIPESILTHDEGELEPFINSLPESGIPDGGNLVELKGYGFFPPEQTEVQWGSQTLDLADFETISPERITFFSPAGNGTITVSVQTPQGGSNEKTFEYDGGGPVPISFTTSKTTSNIGDVNAYPFTGPTQAAWGPDGRLYVATNAGGRIVAITYDDNYNEVARQNIEALAGGSAPDILGISFNPFETGNQPKIYIGHGVIFAKGGACFSGSFDYVGKVSTVTGPNFSSASTLISNLPVSNHDHSVNGIQFDNLGNLLVAVGGNTNAGVEDCAIGGTPESPLAAAVLRAPVWKNNFNGNVQYLQRNNGNVNNDQVDGDIVDLAPGVDVEPYMVGLRNPFDIAFTTWGWLYGTDNGPNPGFGAASTGPNSEIPFSFFTQDEILLLNHGHYYGHPNRNRGLRDGREYIYRNYEDASIFGEYTGALGAVSSSSNGIAEYRSEAFNGQMRGDLLIQEWNGVTYRAKLSSDKRSIQQLTLINSSDSGLDVITGPGGAILFIDYSENKVSVLTPNDSGVTGTKAYDVFPWRAPVSGGRSFVIGGKSFGSLANTTVKFDGKVATLTSVSSNRIRGTIPSRNSQTAGMVDVEVTSNGQTSVIEDGFRYLVQPGQGKGFWTQGASLPVPIGESDGAFLNGVIYAFGTEDADRSGKTIAYDLSTGQWRDDLAIKPKPKSDHHAVVAANQKIYLIGGLPNDGSDLQYPQKEVKIYDPRTNSWSAGANVPESGLGTGAGRAVSVGKYIYYFGGINAATTSNKLWRYDTIVNNWTELAPMPVGRNHMSAGTDGEKIYAFGGRDAGEEVSPGFAETQIYDIATNTWDWSGNPSSGIPPLPEKRGGLGRAVYLQGEFYVIGGETNEIPGTSATSAGVFNRVDVFNPETLSWRTEAAIPTPRHGLTIVGAEGRIYVVGGGTQEGYSQSDKLEIFER